jgi:membrane protein implicated in regulation of membrane protease activity
LTSVSYSVAAAAMLSDFAYRATAAAVAPLAAGISGLAFAGAVTGVISAIVAIAALFLSVRYNARQERRTLDREIQEAYDRGQASIRDDLEQARREAEFFRNLYFGGRPPEPPAITRDPT